MQNKEHIPVMPKEAIELLKLRKNGIYLDATLGGGGHTALIANYLGKKGKVIGIDQDIEAIKKTENKLSEIKGKVFCVHGNFKDLDQALNQLGIKKVDSILFDLGVSSYQLESPKRGFSFREKEGNIDTFLDMRMDSSQKLTAYDVINRYKEDKLKEIFLKLGEEPYRYAKNIAKNIVLKRKIRPIKTVGDLLEIIRKSTPPKYRFAKKSHYATNVFRAIRMEVNQELSALEEAIPKAVNVLKKGGRLVIISFHSLEDRIVKQTFKRISPNTVKLLTKKPVRASSSEIKKNPKADSAKLRALEKL